MLIKPHSCYRVPLIVNSYFKSPIVTLVLRINVVISKEPYITYDESFLRRDGAYYDQVKLGNVHLTRNYKTIYS